MYPRKLGILGMFAMKFSPEDILIFEAKLPNFTGSYFKIHAVEVVVKNHRNFEW